MASSLVCVDLMRSVFEFLNENTEYAVLRNYDLLPYDNSARDIDLIIGKRQFLSIREEFISLVVAQGWKVFKYYQNEMGVMMFFARQHEGTLHLMEFDFCYNPSAHGVFFLCPEEILKKRIFNGNVYHVDGAYEFLNKYIFNRLVGDFYPEKYRDVRNKYGEDPFVRETLHHLFGCGDIDILDSWKSSKLLAFLFNGNLRRKPVKSIGSFLSFLKWQFRQFSFGQNEVSISFTGPDGVGKTTVIETIIQNLSSVFSKSFRLFHFRPALLPNIGEVARNAHVIKQVDRDFTNPHRGGSTGKVNSCIRLAYYSLDYIFGYLIRIKSLLRSRCIVIFDRYYTDIIVDGRRSRINLNYKFIAALRHLIPHMSYNILLTADPDVILERKKELTRESIEAINQKLIYLSKLKGYRIFFNNESVEVVVGQILEYIISDQHRKIMKRLDISYEEN